MSKLISRLICTHRQANDIQWNLDSILIQHLRSEMKTQAVLGWQWQATQLQLQFISQVCWIVLTDSLVQQIKGAEFGSNCSEMYVSLGVICGSNCLFLQNTISKWSQSATFIYGISKNCIIRNTVGNVRMGIKSSQQKPKKTYKKQKYE